MARTAAHELMEKGAKEFLEDLIRAKFGDVSHEVKARLDKGSRADLKRWGTRILKADSIDEVFARSRR